MNRLKTKQYVASRMFLVIFTILLLIVLDMDEMSWLRLKLRIDRVVSIPRFYKEPKFQEPCPLLILFTTFKETSSHHVLAHRAIIHNWASFNRDLVKPVLFTDGPFTNRDSAGKVRHKHRNLSLAEEALANGWHVLPIQSTNSYGTPHLKPMYEIVFEKYNSTFYGYANGDILFDNSLINNLQTIKHFMGNLKENVLLVGKRTDVSLNSHAFNRSLPASLGRKTSGESSESLSKSILNIAQLFNKSTLKMIAKKGQMREPYAMDYFIFTKQKSTFDWNKIPNIVVGRIAYDQYLVAEAIQFHVNTVDLSRTTLCLHLSKPGVLDTGLLNEDRDYNLELLGKNYPYHKGLTSRTTYYMYCDDDADNDDEHPFLVRRTAIFRSLGSLFSI